MKKRLSVIVTIVAIGLAAAPGRGQQLTKTPGEEPLLKVAAELIRADPVDPVLKKGFHKVYAVKLTAGAFYQIDLVSNDFDAYLRLEDATGKRLAEDDDSGGDLNARLFYKAGKDAMIRIVVTTFEPAKTGKFQLTVTKSTRAAFERHQLLTRAYRLHDQGRGLQSRGQMREAIERMQSAVDLCRKAFPKDQFPNGDKQLADMLNNFAFALQEQAQYARAEPLFREALAMCRALYPKTTLPHGHWRLAAAIENLGVLLQAKGEMTGAERCLRESLAMYEAVYPRAQYPDGHRHLAGNLFNLAGVLAWQGDYVAAEPLYRAALAMYESHYPKAVHPRGHPDIALVMNNLGALMQGKGEYAQAERLFRAALAMNETLYLKRQYPQGHERIADSLRDLGFLMADQGEYARAEPLYVDALAMRRALFPKEQYPSGHTDVADSLRDLANLLRRRGEHAKAEPLLRDALVMCRALFPKENYPNGHPDIAHSLEDLALLLAAKGDDAGAEVLYREALAIRQQCYPKANYPRGHPELAASLNLLGLIVGRRGDYATAEQLLEKALAMDEALHPKTQYPYGHVRLAWSLNYLGETYLVQGKHTQAEATHRAALTMYTRLVSRLAEAAPEAVALNAAARFPLSRDLFLTSASHLGESDLRTYETVWHSRAAVTRVYQRRHIAVSAAATDDTVRKSWDELQGLRRRRARLIMSATPSNPKGAEDGLTELNRQIDALERDLGSQVPILKRDADLARLGPDALQKLLPADAVLIDFLRYAHFEAAPAEPGGQLRKRTVRYLAFVVRRDGVRRVELGAAENIDTAVRQWRETITAQLPAANEAARTAHEAKLANQALALRRLVWVPVAKHLPKGTGTVYLAPDGELTQLPWAALPGEGKDRVLLDGYALGVLPHGPFLLEQLTAAAPRSLKRPPPAEGFLLVGGIRYDDKPAAASAVAGRGANVVEQKMAWNFLKGTEQERLLLAKVLEKSGPKLAANLSGNAAASDLLRHELERCRFAHLATHGFFADARFRSLLQLDSKLFDRIEYLEGTIGQRIGAGARDPLVLSGLVCAGANRPDTPDRGILSGDAIAGLFLDDLYLATLSACDTGIGDVAGGEGVFGLQRAFHIAGCKNVIASLWKVDDAATAALMVRFYGYLFPERRGQETHAERGLPPIEALRRAQLDLYRHPELIPAWARGEERGPVRPRPATAPPPPGTPPELLTSDGRAPIRLWAAFTLSGAGRN